MNPPKKILSLFKKDPAPVGWLPADRLYPRLAADMAGVPAQPGIYALWQRGVRPQWLRVGAAKNLAAALAELAQAPDIAALGIDVFAAWTVPPASQHAGIVRFLCETLHPALQEDAHDAPPIAFPLPPGTTL